MRVRVGRRRRSRSREAKREGGTWSRRMGRRRKDRRIAIVTVDVMGFRHLVYPPRIPILHALLLRLPPALSRRVHVHHLPSCNTLPLLRPLLPLSTPPHTHTHIRAHVHDANLNGTLLDDGIGKRWG